MTGINKMKVAILTQELGGGAFGNVARTLAKSLVKYKISQVELLCLKKKNKKNEFELPSRCCYVSLNATRMAFALPSLIFYLRKNNPDIMIAMPSYVNIVAILAKIISRWKGKLVITEHAVMSQKTLFEHKNELLMGHIHLLAKLTYPFADGIVSVSQGVMRNLNSILNIDNKVMKVIPNAVDLNLVRCCAAQKTRSDICTWLSSKNKEPCFVSIGRLVEEKNFTVMIRAFAEVLKNYSAKLIIIGDGYLKDDLNDEISSLNLENSIKLIGYCKNPFPFLAAADGFLLSSKEEAFGLVLVEALALGIPIVSTDAIGGGPREILCDGEFGILTVNDSPRDFAEGIKLLCADRNLREKLKNNGLVRAADFHPDVMGENWTNLFNEL